MAKRRVNDAVHWFMSELTSRIVAESGIPSDRFHPGKIILRSFKDYPDAVMQIDGATGESDTNASILEKSVKCATSFRNFGLKQGDVMVLMAPNHIALSVPFYAALYTGVIIAVVDMTFGVKELQSTFSGSQPKIIFCQSEKAPDVRLVLNIIDHNATIVTFNDGDFCSLTEFVEKYGDNTPIEDFKPTDFDAENSTFLLLPTSGSTGSPKNVELTFKNFLIAISTHWSIFTTFPTPTALSLVGAPLQWISAVMHYIISPIFKYTRLQSSRSLTTEHACYLINTYKPTYTIFSPTFMATLMKDGIREKCDLSCFENIYLGGSAVPPSLIEDIKNNYPNIEVFNLFGMSEIAGPLFLGDSEYPKSCGKPMNCVQYRIVDIDTQKDISDPNVSGEIWVKGPSIFKGYYKNLAATAEVFTEDGWFKTGDLFYRDEIWNYYFVERIKILLKYKSHQISPVEIENVIRQHPGVLDVAVTGIQDHECGDLPVACVVAKEGYIVTADEIKGLVKDSLSDSKQLRGGVVIINSIPVTASTKVHRKILKDMLQDLERQ